MIEYVREMNKNYLKITHDNNAPDYCMKMLENNVIEGFLATRSVSVNNELSYMYDISGCIPLEEKYMGVEFSTENIVHAAGMIREIIRISENYMLDIDGILFDSRYIFCGINDASWSFVYNSGMASDARAGIKRIMEFILGRLNHKDNNAVILGYGLYKRICRDEIGLAQVFEELDELESRNAETEERGVEYELSRRQYPSVAPEIITQEEEKRPPDLRKYIAAAAAVSLVISVLIGLTVGAAAVFFSLAVCAAAACALYIVNIRGHLWEKIVRREVRLPYEVDTPELVIGASEENNDATIIIGNAGNTYLRRVTKDGTAADEYTIITSPLNIGSGAASDIVIKDSGISRLHARLTKEGKMYFIKDMNSTNGTWVNEHRLSVYEMCPVKAGDIIRLAQSRFELIDTSE